MTSSTIAVTDLSERLLTPAYDQPFVLERACKWLRYPCTDPDTSDRFATCRLVLRRSARRIQRAYRHHYITRDPAAPSSALSHLSSPSQQHQLPEWATCPISRDVVREPVLLLTDGHLYDRASADAYLAHGYTVSPITRAPCAPSDWCALHEVGVRVRQLTRDLHERQQALQRMRNTLKRRDRRILKLVQRASVERLHGRATVGGGGARRAEGAHGAHVECCGCYKRFYYDKYVSRDECVRALVRHVRDSHTV